MLAYWVLAVRPRTLVAGVIPVLVAGALTHEMRMVFWALIAALCIQIATNLFNDVFDGERGADVERVGPVRVVQAGLLSKEQVKIGAWVVSFVGALAALPVVIPGGWLGFIGLFMALLLAYGYTGGPFPLAYHGLGEPFAFAFFGLFPVVYLVWLSRGEICWEAFLAGGQVGFFAMALLAANNFRDRIPDSRVDKRTFAVCFGEKAAHIEVLACVLFPFILQPLWLWGGYVLGGLLPLMLLPLLLPLLKKPTLEGIAYLYLFFGCCLCLGIF